MGNHAVECEYCGEDLRGLSSGHSPDCVTRKSRHALEALCVKQAAEVERLQKALKNETKGYGELRKECDRLIFKGIQLEALLAAARQQGAEQMRETDSPEPAPSQEDGRGVDRYIRTEAPVQAIRYTGSNLRDVLDFTGKDPRFDEWFDDFEDYQIYVLSHGMEFRILGDVNQSAMPGDWIVKNESGRSFVCAPDYFESSYQKADHAPDRASGRLVPDSIDWDHVDADYKWMARDEDGSLYVFCSKPALMETFWIEDNDNNLEINGFASYKRGTVDWKDSLVKRPDGAAGNASNDLVESSSVDQDGMRNHDQTETLSKI